MIIIFYVALFLYISTLSLISNIVDYDFWARLIVGKTFFQTGTLLNFDFQSFGPTRQWFDHEWGSSLVFYSILDNFGDTGILVFKALIIFATYFILTRIILLRRRHLYKSIKLNPLKEASFNILFFVLLTQSTLVIVNSTVRCHLFTFLFFVIWLYTLEKSRLEHNNRILWILPVSMIIWSNMHGGCFTGLGLLALYIVGEFLNKKQIKPYIITFILSIAALFINPYGPKYVYFLFHAITLSRPAITEWQPLFGGLYFDKLLKFKFWGAGITTLSWIILNRKYKNQTVDNRKKRLINIYKSLDKTKAIILIIMLLLSLKSVRIMPFFAFCSAAFLYDDIYQKVLNKKLPNFINNIKEIFLCTLLLFSFIYTIKTTKIEILPSKFPYVEAEFLKANNLKGNVFANFHYGSFLAYKLYPNNYIFMDGRYEETYEPNLLKRVGIIFEDDNWKEELHKQHIDYIIIEKNQGKLASRLYYDNDWTPVMASNEFILFVRNNIKLNNPKIPTNDFEYYKKHKWETNIDWR